MTKEAYFYLPLYRGANAEGWGLYRIADGTWGKKPFDIGGCDPTGRGVALEVKLVKRAIQWNQPLPWRQFEDHQIRWLKHFAIKPDALALVALANCLDNSVWVFELHGSDFLHSPAVRFKHKLLDGSGLFYRGWNRFIDFTSEGEVITAGGCVQLQL